MIEERKKALLTAIKPIIDQLDLIEGIVQKKDWVSLEAIKDEIAKVREEYMLEAREDFGKNDVFEIIVFTEEFINGISSSDAETIKHMYENAIKNIPK